MSGQSVDVIVKAIQDKKFCSLLFSDPDQALKGFRLTDEETDGLKSLDRRTFDKAVAEMGVELETRIKQGGVNVGDSRLKYTDYPVVVVEK